VSNHGIDGDDQVEVFNHGGRAGNPLVFRFNPRNAPSGFVL